MQTCRKLTLPLIALAMTAVAVTGCGSGSGKNLKIDGIDGPKVSYLDGKFLMTITFKFLQMDGGLRMPMPKMPNSYLEFAPDLASNGTLLAIGVSISDIKLLSDAKILPPTELPGGRPLPGLIDGRAPGMAVTVPKLNNITFYVGAKLFGLFIPMKLGFQQAIGTFRFYADNGRQIGNISIVGEDAKKENSGFLLMINLASSTIAPLMAKN